MRGLLYAGAGGAGRWTNFSSSISRSSGRLLGDVRNPDYDFLDSRLTAFYEGLTGMVSLTGWIHGLEAVTLQLGCAWHEVAMMERLFPPLRGMARYKDELRRITKGSNDLLLTVVDDLSYVYSDGRATQWNPADVEQRRTRILDTLHAERDAFVFRHQEILLEALGIDRVPAVTGDGKLEIQAEQAWRDP